MQDLGASQPPGLKASSACAAAVLGHGLTAGALHRCLQPCTLAGMQGCRVAGIGGRGWSEVQQPGPARAAPAQHLWCIDARPQDSGQAQGCSLSRCACRSVPASKRRAATHRAPGPAPSWLLCGSSLLPEPEPEPGAGLAEGVAVGERVLAPGPPCWSAAVQTCKPTSGHPPGGQVICA